MLEPPKVVPSQHAPYIPQGVLPKRPKGSKMTRLLFASQGARPLLEGMCGNEPYVLARIGSPYVHDPQRSPVQSQCV